MLSLRHLQGHVVSLPATFFQGAGDFSLGFSTAFTAACGLSLRGVKNPAAGVFFEASEIGRESPWTVKPWSERLCATRGPMPDTRCIRSGQSLKGCCARAAIKRRVNGGPMPRNPSSSASLAWLTSKAIAGDKKVSVKPTHKKYRDMMFSQMKASIAAWNALNRMNWCLRKNCAALFVRLTVLRCVWGDNCPRLGNPGIARNAAMLQTRRLHSGSGAKVWQHARERVEPVVVAQG
jgi:hypothetical protein